MIRFKQIFIQICVLTAVLVGFRVFASEFDPTTEENLAPEMLVVREDAQGNRVLLAVEEAPKSLKTENEKRALIEQAEKMNLEIFADEGGAEGSGPNEFDEATGTPAWYYWYYPRTNYSYWYSWGRYSYYPTYSYNWGRYRYWYYYRW
jgi:hypothetical protein